MGTGIWQTQPDFTTRITTAFGEKLNRLPQYKIVENPFFTQHIVENDGTSVLAWLRRVNRELETRRAILMPGLNDANLQDQILETDTHRQ